MTEILKGKPVADQLKEEMKERIHKLSKVSCTPTLAVVRVGNNANDISYEKGIKKNCETLGIAVDIHELDSEIDTEGLIEKMQQLNAAQEISGILVFRPLPKHIEEDRIRLAIDPGKDVDCMHPLNLARIFESDFSRFVPATPMAAMKMMDHYGIDLEGKNVAIVNRSLVFGRPLAMMLLSANATPMICHSRTQNLKKVLQEADVVIVAMGRAESLDRSMFTPESIIIDVGVSANAEGKVAGDAKYDDLIDFVDKITPVPGGVGSITTTILLDQVVKAAEQSHQLA